MKAFPTTHTDIKGYFMSREHGMELVDYFAAKAMLGFLSNAYLAKKEPIPRDTMAKISYELANAMMEARNDNNNSGK